MSTENVAAVQAIFAAWERGDFSSADWAHPEIEFVIADGPAPGRWTGLAGLADGFRAYVSTWSEYRVEAEEYRELDDERVLVVILLGGRGKTSGLDLEQLGTRAANLFHLSDGRVTQLTLYFDAQNALADLGLSG